MILPYYKCLLGSTKYNDLVFGTFEITNRRYERPEFTASFEVVHPFRRSSVDVTEIWEDRLDDYDNDWKYQRCDEFDCSPSELVGNLVNEYHEITDLIDCSLYDEVYTIDGEDWYFESMACGQHDSSDEMLEYVNKDAYDTLMDLWNNYHLKTVDGSIIEKVKQIGFKLADVDEEAWITDFIKRHVNEL